MCKSCHIVEIAVEIKNLEALTRAAERLGGTLDRSAKLFSWYGKPEACHGKISFPDTKYEIGLVEIGLPRSADRNPNGDTSEYRLRWDPFNTTLYNHINWPDDHSGSASKLIQAYAAEAAKHTAQAQRLAAYEVAREDGTIEVHVEVME